MDSSRPDSGLSRVYRHRLPVRLWHWCNALAVVVLLMSGMAIFNAHPRLYWGQKGAHADPAWLEIGRSHGEGYLRVGALTLPTFGPVGTRTGNRNRAFGPSLTIPSRYDLAASRGWHFTFAWLLGVPGLAYLAWSVLGGHLRRDLMPRRAEIAPGALWHDLAAHARLRFPRGSAALVYNPLQKLAYLAVLTLLVVMVLTGLAMAPAMDAAWPWLTAIWGGRQSARSVHFICATGIALFLLVHLAMVLLAGPVNEIRAMITGRWQVKP